MGSNCYTSALLVVTIGVQGFVPSWPQGLYPNFEDNGARLLARKRQFGSSCQCLLQITCQPGTSSCVQRDGS